MNTAYLVLCILLSSDPQVRTLTGYAESKEGVALYELRQREVWSSGAWTQRSVSGRRPDGQEFFRQVITPGQRAAVPNISMTYNGSQKGFSVSWRDGVVEMSFTNPKGDTIKNSLKDPPNNLVGPGGILAAIRKDWKALKDGKTLAWKMIVPPKADAYSVRLVPKGIEDIDGTRALRVTLEADNWIVRLVAPSTDFWIDLEHRSTLRYFGMGASDNPSGLPQEAFIKFKPPMLPVIPPR